MVVEIDDQVTMLKAARPFRRGSGRAPERRLDAGKQLGEAQRLGDVVLRAELEAADLVGFGATSSHEQDGHATEFADALEDLPTVEAGERHVRMTRSGWW
jgi:hypothetical protein